MNTNFELKQTEGTEPKKMMFQQYAEDIGIPKETSPEDQVKIAADAVVTAIERGARELNVDLTTACDWIVSKKLQVVYVGDGRFEMRVGNHE